MFDLFNSKKIKEIPEELINRDYINIPSNNLNSNINVSLYKDESYETENIFGIELQDSENNVGENMGKLNTYNYGYIQDDDEGNDEDRQEDNEDEDDQDEDDQDEDEEYEDFLNDDELYVISLDNVPKFYSTDLKTAQNKI
jgi:hypothetical protein